MTIQRLPKTVRFIFASLLILLTSAAHANLQEGDPVSIVTLEDQFEQPQSLKTNTVWLLFAHDMDGTNIARDALAAQTAESMSELGIQFYADISGMPGLISKFIAMPRLQKLAYPIALAREEEKLAFIPRQDDKTTVVQLEQGNVKSIVIADSAEQVKALLNL